MIILLLPFALIAVLVVAILALRNALGEDSPSWLRGTTIAIGLAFVFFLFSGFGVVALIFGLIGANPPVIVTAFILFALAVITPVVVWLIVRPGLRRRRAVEREQAEVMRAEYERRFAERQAAAEQIRRERLAAMAEARERARLEYGGTGAGGLDPQAADRPVYYEILGVDVSATTDEIEIAYRREIRAHHPDRGGESRRAQLINEAYETLRDPERRRRYDRESGLL